MRTFSAKGRSTLTEPWEECVLYVYDDKVPKRRINGRMQYPEWDGGPVKGTLTIGFGHTDAAGAPKIHQGMRVTAEEADQILSQDLAPVERVVNRALHVDVTQHQFDMIVDATFNCYSLLKPVAALINAGNIKAVPAKMMQYTCSKGEHMQGLVNRRAAEIQFGNMPDDEETAQAEQFFAPKAEASLPPKTMAQSKTSAAATTIGFAGFAAVVQAVNDALEPIKAFKGSVDELGLVDMIDVASHSQMFWLGIVVVGLAAFVWWDRRHKLVNDHV